jgi:hypothetical protein
MRSAPEWSEFVSLELWSRPQMDWPPLGWTGTSFASRSENRTLLVREYGVHGSMQFLSGQSESGPVDIVHPFPEVAGRIT